VFVHLPPAILVSNLAPHPNNYASVPTHISVGIDLIDFLLSVFTFFSKAPCNVRANERVKIIIVHFKIFVFVPFKGPVV
jgi:hypothetical protein